MEKSELRKHGGRWYENVTGKLSSDDFFVFSHLFKRLTALPKRQGASS
jgi:hypothetical protein